MLTILFYNWGKEGTWHSSSLLKETLSLSGKAKILAQGDFW